LKNIFITGATSGIGMEAAIELAAHGNRVIATARSIEKGDELLQYYRESYPYGKGIIEIVLCDLASFESIIKACNHLNANYACIDVLINNAAVWNFAYKESQDQIEETFHVNVLAPLLINHLLLDLLLKAKHAKSIFAASALHHGKVNFEDLECKRNFNGFNTYRQSKLEIILLTRLLAQKLASVNIGVYCEHPGLVSTKLGRDASWASNLFFRLLGISAHKGAKTLIYLAEENTNFLVSGGYYYKKQVKETSPQSKDMDVAQRLLENIKSYLKDFIETPSLIFETESIPQENYFAKNI
jgi:retinol dehydrogenase 14